VGCRRRIGSASIRMEAEGGEGSRRLLPVVPG
jgi:hypothetical protein